MLHLDPMDREIYLMKNAPRSMTYREGEDFAAWQVRAREKLAELLGLPLDMPESDNFHIEYERDEPEFHEIRFSYSSEPLVDVCSHLMIPHGATGKLPMVICLQGHSKGMHLSLGRAKYPGDAESIKGDRDLGLQVVRAGRIALLIEQRGFGERGGNEDGPQCHVPSMAALLLGRTILGERCWDVFRGLDCVLAHFDCIDTDKIAMIGQSSGGTTTEYAMALDERIKAGIPGSSFGPYLESVGVQKHCLCNFVPGIMNYFDMGDLIAMIAPRPVVIMGGRYDPIFPIDSVMREIEVVKRAYAAAGAPDNIRQVIGEGEHRFYAADTWPVFNDVTGW